MEQEDEDRQPASRFSSYGDAVASVFGLHRPICMRSSMLARASRRPREPGASRRPAALFGLLAPLLALGCLGVPDGVEPVQGFELDRYLGRWYEIARLDHSFERGLERVSADYSLSPGGEVKVVNRGFSTADNEWNEAVGRASFVERDTEGYLKVSFFGPFYGSYVIFELDREGYEHAFVSGPNTSYLWLLARSPTVDEGLIDRFESRAAELGFDTSGLIRVKH